MKKNKMKIIFTLILIFFVFITTNSYSHSGRTDSSGGHKDNKNKSGLGSYHYHCGGHPAHLHTNGVCPYSSNSSSSSAKIIDTVQPNVDVTQIKINEYIVSLEIGKSKKLTATITPSNVTDKNISWKSSDDSIASISQTGEITAKKCGIVDITASSSNGKTSTITINIKEAQKVENSIALATIKNNTKSNTIPNDGENINPIGGIFTIGILGGGGYALYKKYINK